jgi:hypothetical protein
MSLSALVYRSRKTLTIDVESLGVVTDDRTGEYYFPTPEHDGKFSREAFIASEFWIGNVMSVAELREELRTITKRDNSLLLETCFYSGSHSGDVIAVAMLPALEEEVRHLLGKEKTSLSKYFIAVLDGLLELIETAKRESNPIVFV